MTTTTKKKTKQAPKTAVKRGPGRPLGKAHDLRTRERIQTSTLINTLHNNAVGLPSVAVIHWLEEYGADLSKQAINALKKLSSVPMPQSRVNSCIALINRTLPVLQATEIHDTRDQDDTEHMDDTTLYSIAGGKDQ